MSSLFPDRGLPDGEGRPRPTRVSEGRWKRPAEITPRRRVKMIRRIVLRTFLGTVLLMTNVAVVGYLLVEVPSPTRVATLQSNIYLYADGSPLARDGQVNRESVPLARVPLHVRRAVLAAEDRDFYSSASVDVRAMVRGAWRTVTGEGVQSGSTITQQFVKNYYLDQDQTLARKARELVISVKLGRNESKDAIFQGYLNTSFFGRNAYGVEAAAQAYYAKSVDRLTVAEGAYLAVLLNAPSRYDVLARPENRTRVLRRWRYVLDGMVEQSWLTRADRATMVFPPPRPPQPPAGLAGQRGYLVEAVRNHLVEKGIVDETRLAAGGYRIVTTIHRNRQEDLVRAVDAELVASLDSRRPQDRFVRVGGVSMDPSTGEVVALYGGYDYIRQYVSNATRHDYQAGSAFKPVVLAAALAHGSVTQEGKPIGPDTVYDGTSERPVVTADGPIGYAPGNEDGVDYGPITLRTATEKSVNSVYAQLAADVGADRVVSTAVALGLPAATPGLLPSPAIALGAAQPSVLDLTGVYATLANHGARVEPTVIRNITHDGATIGFPARNGVQVIPRTAADGVTAMLVGAVNDGTGAEAKSLGRPVAGKTGTAEDDRAAWFAGYTPELATVVAVMGQDPVSGTLKSLYGALGEARINGGGFPARIWAAYTAAALRGSGPSGFVLQRG
ncbi:transglycosylase domain-containing protein [Streptomyces sp. NPDC008343]|uniref:transglycosylase domain-containing protein n=1 Tax=Streptomyces sp. NPDC008343 TaxID=3364828 RepID=UPI0036ED49AE